jgi:hypothetical protein
MASNKVNTNSKDTTNALPRKRTRIHHAPGSQRAIPTLSVPTQHRCARALHGIMTTPAYREYHDVKYGNCDGFLVTKFYDTALRNCGNIFSVVVGGRASGKMTKLLVLMEACGGCAELFDSECFREYLFDNFGILINTSRPMLLIVCTPGDLPRTQQDLKDGLSMHRTYTDGGYTLGFAITFDGKPACVAMIVDEDEVQELASIGLNLNILRLGPLQYHEPALPQDNSATLSGENKIKRYISSEDMLPLLRVGGALYAAWDALISVRQDEDF